LDWYRSLETFNLSTPSLFRIELFIYWTLDWISDRRMAKYIKSFAVRNKDMHKKSIHGRVKKQLSSRSVSRWAGWRGARGSRPHAGRPPPDCSPPERPSWRGAVGPTCRSSMCATTVSSWPGRLSSPTGSGGPSPGSSTHWLRACLDRGYTYSPLMVIQLETAALCPDHCEAQDRSHHSMLLHALHSTV
jgi:hypothetical protein